MVLFVFDGGVDLCFFFFGWVLVGPVVAGPLLVVLVFPV